MQENLKIRNKTGATEPGTLQLRSVCRRFGSIVAVDDVSLHVGQGEFVTLLGPSGCGKTTLLRMIAGFGEPDTGSILLGADDITRTPPEFRPVNMVFQRYALFPHLTVAGNIAYGLSNRGLRGAELAKRIDGALEMVDLAGYKDRKIDRLSGGQQQRVALARALVNEPAMLLLDEPLSALDRQLRLRMQIELRSLQQRLGITFLFVTHDQEEALTMSDRIVVMNAGRVEQIGAPQEIYLRPKSRFVASFVGENNLIPVRKDARGGATPVTEDAATHLLVVPPEGWGSRGEGDLTITGTVEDRLFLGNTFRILLRLPDGTVLKVDERAPTAARGEQMTLHLEAAQSWFVPVEEGER